MGYLLNYSGMYLHGAGYTILVSFIAVIGGFIIGLLASLARLSKSKILNIISAIYVEVIRDTPLFVQVMIIAFALPQIGINFPSFFGLSGDFTGAAFALTLNSGAYISKIMRSGIQSINKGQMEASRSLGLNYWQSMRYVIVPQAIKNILPALANEFVTLVKESAILSAVGISEIMFVSGAVANATYKAMGPYLVAMVLYFIITFTLSRLIGRFEKKLNSNGR